MCGCCEPVWPKEKTEDVRLEKKAEDTRTKEKEPAREPALTR